MPANLKTLFSGTMAPTQTFSIGGSPTGGYLYLAVRGIGFATTAVAYNASAATIATALAALSTVGAGNVTVTGSAGGPFVVVFSGAALDANGASPRLVAAANLMTGGVPTVSVVGGDVDVYVVPSDGSVSGVKIATGTLTNISGDRVVVGAGITPSGSTSGARYKSLFGYTLEVNETFSLKDYIGGDLIGPGDKISVYSSVPGGVSAKVTGAVVLP